MLLAVRVRLGALAVVLLAGVCVTTSASADRLFDEPNLGPRVTLSQQMLDKMNLWSAELGYRLNRLSLETVQWNFDARKRRARIGFDSGHSHRLSLQLDSDIIFKGGYARIKTRINLGIVGANVDVDLPAVDLIPRSYDGQRYVEVRLPLLRGTF